MIAIVKYNAGNTTSVQNALHRLGAEVLITDDANQLQQADKVIFPGVGEASTAMEYLRAKQLDQVIVQLQQPVLGICLGQQLMCASSAEGNVSCLGIFDAVVQKFPDGNNIVPHMGWNSLQNIKGPLLAHITAEQNVYFVHSYYASISNHTIATCDYIVPFSAAMQKDNFYATQFHPEKSADVGTIILKNFLQLS